MKFVKDFAGGSGGKCRCQNIKGSLGGSKVLFWHQKLLFHLFSLLQQLPPHTSSGGVKVFFHHQLLCWQYA